VAAAEPGDSGRGLLRRRTAARAEQVDDVRLRKPVAIARTAKGPKTMLQLTNGANKTRARRGKQNIRKKRMHLAVSWATAGALRLAALSRARFVCRTASPTHTAPFANAKNKSPADAACSNGSNSSNSSSNRHAAHVARRMGVSIGVSENTY
jgi:hypothetical protein